MFWSKSFLSIPTLSQIYNCTRCHLQNRKTTGVAEVCLLPGTRPMSPPLWQALITRARAPLGTPLSKHRVPSRRSPCFGRRQSQGKIGGRKVVDLRQKMTTRGVRALVGSNRLFPRCRIGKVTILEIPGATHFLECYHQHTSNG